MSTEIKKQRRGFAAMSKEKHREIASKGGKAAQASGNGHRFTAEEAREAGRIGGAIMATRKEHMSAIGRKGALKRHENWIDRELNYKWPTEGQI